MKLSVPLILLLIFLNSCTAYRGAPPSVRLVNVQLGEVSLFETNLQIETRIQNESPEPLRLGGAVHEVSLNGVYLGRAVNSERITIPPLESRIQSATFRVSNFSILNQVRELLERERLDYSLDSKLYLANSAFKKEISLSEKGTLFQ